MGYGNKGIQDWMDEIEDWAKEKGWWDEDLGNTNVSEKLMLVVTEVAEAMEETRKPEVMKHGYKHVYPTGDPGTLYSEKDSYDKIVKGEAPAKPEGFGIELADVVIRVFDLAAFLKIDLERMIRIKIEYNRTRPHRHGGKLA